MKSFSSYISEARLINSDGYPPGTEIFLTSKTWISTELLKMYDEGSIFTVHREVSRHRTISPVKSGRADVEYWVKAPDGKIFKLIGSVSAIQDTFGNVGSKERGSGGKLDATKFEKDIINEIRRRNGSGPITGANGSSAAKDLAKRVVDSLTSVAGKPVDSYALSGSSKTTSITDVYKNFGLKSGEAKTDISVTISKEHLCTVKKREGSQFASAQANECSAVIQAVFMESTLEKVALAKKISDIVKTGMTKENFYRLRRENENFDELLATVLGLRSGATIKRGDMTALQNIMAETGLTIRITSELTNFLQNDRNKIAVFTEFITGRKRFTDKRFIPDTLFAWGMDGSVYWKNIDSYIKEAYAKGAFKYNIRDRGTGRGGALRLEPIHMESLNDEERKFHSILVEDFNREMDEMVLQEGILDSLRKGLSKVGSVAMDVVRWVAETAKKIWSFIATLISKGIGVLMQVFGVEAEATIQYGPF